MRNSINLFIKNLKTRIKSKKLNYIKIKLFFIKVRKKTVKYKLKLPNSTTIYPIFYMLLLKLAYPKTST